MLSYGHARWAEPESNRRPPPYQRGALPPELSAVVRASGRGWNRTSSLLCVRQALSRVELLARAHPGQGIEPRSPRSERGVLPVRRPRSEWGADASPSIPRLGDRRSRRGTGCRRRSGRHVRPYAERCCPCHSPTLRPWIADRRLRRSAAVVVLRGGALEPELRTRSQKNAGKSERLIPAPISGEQR